MKIESWNTGNPYTAEGQRIAATIGEDEHLYFVDFDRGIYGRSENRQVVAEGQLRRATMRVYGYQDGIAPAYTCTGTWHPEHGLTVKALEAAAKATPIIQGVK
jgi:hypothetical protein